MKQIEIAVKDDLHKNFLNTEDSIKSTLSILEFLYKKTNNTDKYKIVKVRQGKLQRLINEGLMNKIDRKIYDRELSQIFDVVFELIESLSEKEAQKYHIHKNCTQTRILIVCTEKDREADMNALFPSILYPGSKVVFSEPMKCMTNKYDLIIIDGFSNDPDVDRRKLPSLFKEYFDFVSQVKGKTMYMMYFGPHNNDLRNPDYKDLVYYSNSKFSIHTRLQEMLTYIKTKETNLK